METVKVSSRGRIVIPKSLRESQRISSGDRLIVTVVGYELRLKPVSVFRPSNLKSVAGMLHRPGAKVLSDKQLKQRIARQLHAKDNARTSR